MTLTQSVTAKAFVAFVAAAMVVSLVAPAAKADTTSDLQAQITALMAQIEALKGMTTASPTCSAIPAPLTVGAKGVNVTSLQNYLISAGQTIPAGATGYFGGQTRAAVAAWQSANGVAPAVGYYGPVTAAAMSAKCNATVPTTPTTPTTPGTTTTPTTGGVTLGTGEGSIDTVTEISADESSLREGKTEGLVAFETEITGDVSIDRVDFYMDVNSGFSSRASDYFKGAELMADGKKVASLDVRDFTEDTYNEVSGNNGKEYRLRFSGLGLVYKDGQTPNFQLAFEANNVIDSADLSAQWTVALLSDSIRFVDGKGFSDTAGSAFETTFSANAQLVSQVNVTESVDSPDATTLEVSDTDTTKDVAVAVFSVKEKNGVDVTIDDMQFTVSTFATASTSNVVRNASIWDGSTKLASKTVTNTGVVLFENMNLDLRADTRKDLTIKLELGDVDNYNEGATLTVTYNKIATADDENGNNEGDMTNTVGPITSATHTLRSTGLAVAKTTAITPTLMTDATDSSKNYGNYTVNVDVSAFGDDLYIPLTVARGTSTTVGAAYQIEDANGAVVATGTATGASLAYVSGGKVTAQFVQITDGSTARLTLNVPFDPAAVGTYRVQILSVGYTTVASGLATKTELVSPSENFETANLYVTN